MIQHNFTVKWELNHSQLFSVVIDFFSIITWQQVTDLEHNRVYATWFFKILKEINLLTQLIGSKSKYLLKILPGSMLEKFYIICILLNLLYGNFILCLGNGLPRSRNLKMKLMK